MSEDKDANRERLREVAADLKAYYDELQGESPRASAILAVASLEDELERLIRSKFPEDISDRVWNTMAGPGLTPFGTLSAKADTARAFGFYGAETRKIIGTIASVRNKFAHKTNVRHFDHSAVLEKCRELADTIFSPSTIVESAPAEHVRWVYLHTVQNLEERLAEIREYRPDLNDDVPDPLP